LLSTSMVSVNNLWKSFSLMTMAKAQLFVSQDEFTCSVCLEILSDPVTIPCGHSFCLKCLTDCWDQSQECSCPQCRETFLPRPGLRRSTLLNEVIKKLKKTVISHPPLPQPQNYASPGDVECDFCTGNKFRAVKSCLTCMAKYPDHPDRFDWWPQVLCREALTGTRCYWEVEWRGDEMLIGVVYEGLHRKGDGEEFCLGFNDKSWSLWWSHSHYNVCHNSQKTVIGAPYSPRIGVYLDWPAGSLSFYSISHTMTLLHRFNTSFTEPLYPGCYLGCKSTVTICQLIKLTTNDALTRD
uniref:Uncharacterized protein n=1 Tax=Erpetoichthys calabaricus TaxID=27687 RepID=A0A8C4T2W0_ERPCA